MSTREIKFPHSCSPVEYDKYLDKILYTIYRVGKASSSKEIQQKDSTLGDHICIGRGCSFLSWLGLLKGKQSPFDFTEEGRQIAIEIAQGKEDLALNVWKKILPAHELYSELQTYMKAQGGNSGTSLGFGEHLRKLSGKSLNSNFVKEAGKRICVLLAGKGLLDFNREEDIISFPTEGTKVPPKPPITPQAPSVPATSTQPVKVNISGSPPIQANLHTNLPCNINITVEAKDPDSIKQVINLIRELTGQKSEPS
jgi:hypothetical protein